MKKLLLLIAFTPLFTIGQTVNDVPISEIESDFVEIVGTGKAFSNKLTISLDFGQEVKFMSSKSQSIKGADGKPIVFNSMIDALNFMSKNGYKFEQAYTVTVGQQNVYHYLMSKK